MNSNDINIRYLLIRCFTVRNIHLLWNNLFLIFCGSETLFHFRVRLVEKSMTLIKLVPSYKSFTHRLTFRILVNLTSVNATNWLAIVGGLLRVLSTRDLHANLFDGLRTMSSRILSNESVLLSVKGWKFYLCNQLLARLDAIRSCLSLSMPFLC